MPRDYRLQVDDILEAIRRIRNYTKGMTETAFATDQKTRIHPMLPQESPDQ